VEEKTKSVWVYIGIGCAILAALGIIVVAGVTYMGYRAIRNVRQDMVDPVRRTEKVKTILGCKDLPEGYHAAMTLSVPFLLDMAMLSDIEPKFGEGGKHDELFGQRGFIYVKTLRARNEKDFDDYLAGRKDISEMMKPGEVTLESGKTIGHGDLEAGGATVKYIAHEGSIRVHRQERKGLVSIMNMRCPGDAKFRMGIWFGPEVAAPEGDATANYSGTPADPEAIKSFLSHFNPCQP